VKEALIFNHHSLPFENREQARRMMAGFLKVCLGARRLGFTTILMDYSQDTTWFRVQLAKRYYWQDWYNEFKNDPEYREQITAFRTIITKSPIFQPEEIDELFDLEEPYGGKKYFALRAAAFFNLPIVSFLTTLPWNQNPIAVICFTLNEAGQEEKFSRNIINWYSYEVFSQNEQHFLEERNASITSGRELRNHLNVFSSIAFCSNALEQLENWTGGNNLIFHITEALTVLNVFADKWKQGVFPDYSHEALRELGLKHRASGESASVSNHPEKRKERLFWLPTGEKEFFGDHIKLPNGYRLHFYPESHTKTIYIGYIGIHLSL
jgi:hypothetical protein